MKFQATALIELDRGVLKEKKRKKKRKSVDVVSIAFLSLPSSTASSDILNWIDHLTDSYKQRPSACPRRRISTIFDEKETFSFIWQWEEVRSRRDVKEDSIREENEYRTSLKTFHIIRCITLIIDDDEWISEMEKQRTERKRKEYIQFIFSTLWWCWWWCTHIDMMTTMMIDKHTLGTTIIYTSATFSTMEQDKDSCMDAYCSILSSFSSYSNRRTLPCDLRFIWVDIDILSTISFDRGSSDEKHERQALSRKITNFEILQNRLGCILNMSSDGHQRHRALIRAMKMSSAWSEMLSSDLEDDVKRKYW